LSNATPTNRMKVDIRTMIESDLDVVLRLEREIFSDPWPRSTFVEHAADEIWGTLVAEANGEIVGYACYYIRGEESHLTNMAVPARYRRKSVAKQLLEYIFGVVTEHRCEYLILEVRPSNTEASAFYEKFGFGFLHRQPNYYRRPVEDALVMVRYFDTDEDDA
jgi:ribosomal-protein-alanine N-acetyltransferase